MTFLFIKKLAENDITPMNKNGMEMSLNQELKFVVGKCFVKK